MCLTGQMIDFIVIVSLLLKIGTLSSFDNKTQYALQIQFKVGAVRSLLVDALFIAATSITKILRLPAKNVTRKRQPEFKRKVAIHRHFKVIIIIIIIK